MRVRAKHWLKYDGIWHQGGDEFEIPAEDAKELEGMIEIADATVSVSEPEDKAEEKAEQPQKKRGRKSKADE